VLLFLRMDAINPQPSAQLVVPALRVLGVGEQLPDQRRPTHQPGLQQ
jgi:hypothetical protein